MHTQRSIAILSPWLVTNLTMYSTTSTCKIIFDIRKGVEYTKLGLLAKFHAQLVGLAALQVPTTHQGTHQRFYHSEVFQL